MAMLYPRKKALLQGDHHQKLTNAHEGNCESGTEMASAATVSTLREAGQECFPRGGSQCSEEEGRDGELWVVGWMAV